MDEISELIEKVRQAVSSEKNKKKGRIQPNISLNIEDPIGWMYIFGADANRYFSDSEFYFRQVLKQKLWKFENIDDDVPISLDIPAWLGHYPEYTFWEMDVRFTEKGVPIIQKDHPLTKSPDLKLLKMVDFSNSGWMKRAFKWHEDLTRIADGRLNVSFISWYRGPLDLAVQLRGYNNFIIDTIERPQFVHDLMKFITENRIKWHDDCASYFKQKTSPVMISDDWINIPMISPDIFADFVLPRYLEIEKHHGGVSYIHSCGNQSPVQKYLLEIKTLNVFENSPWTDLTQTVRNIDNTKSIAVAYHPNDVVLDSEEKTREKLKFIAETCRGRDYGLGTSVTPLTDDISDFLNRINRWLEIAKEELRR